MGSTSRHVIKATKKALRQQGGPVIREGPGDVINLARAKIFAVAMMGTVPTADQVRTIEALAAKATHGKTSQTRPILLLRDADSGIGCQLVVSVGEASEQPIGGGLVIGGDVFPNGNDPPPVR